MLSSQRPAVPALTASYLYFTGLSTPSNRYVMLITNGQPDCGASQNSGCSDAQGLAGELLGINVETKVIVPGQIDGPSDTSQCLQELAAAGGATNYPPYFRSASNPTDLSNTIESVIRDISHDVCVLNLRARIQNSDNPVLYWKDQQVPVTAAGAAQQLRAEAAWRLVRPPDQGRAEDGLHPVRELRPSPPLSGGRVRREGIVSRHFPEPCAQARGLLIPVRHLPDRRTPMTRAWLTVSACTLFAMVAVGCGGDSPAGTGTAGTNGGAGRGGSTGAAGRGGSGGTAGSAAAGTGGNGTAGGGGTAGTGTAGTAGSGTAGAAGGTAGAAGGTAGAAGGTAGRGGAGGGTAGAAGGNAGRGGTGGGTAGAAGGAAGGAGAAGGNAGRGGTGGGTAGAAGGTAGAAGGTAGAAGGTAGAAGGTAGAAGGGSRRQRAAAAPAQAAERPARRAATPGVAGQAAAPAARRCASRPARARLETPARRRAPRPGPTRCRRSAPAWIRRVPRLPSTPACVSRARATPEPPTVGPQRRRVRQRSRRKRQLQSEQRHGLRDHVHEHDALHLRLRGLRRRPGRQRELDLRVAADGVSAGSGSAPRRRACSRSAIRSSACSMPTDRRTSPSPIPSALRRSGGIDAWVMIAGCSASDSTPPRLSAQVKTRSADRKSRARARTPRPSETRS